MHFEKKHNTSVPCFAHSACMLSVKGAVHGKRKLKRACVLEFDTHLARADDVYSANQT